MRLVLKSIFHVRPRRMHTEVVDNHWMQASFILALCKITSVVRVMKTTHSLHATPVSAEIMFTLQRRNDQVTAAGWHEIFQF